MPVRGQPISIEPNHYSLSYLLDLDSRELSWKDRLKLQSRSVPSEFDLKVGRIAPCFSETEYYPLTMSIVGSILTNKCINLRS